jgi:hypothetical protein
MPSLPRRRAAGGADPHVRLRPRRVEPHPGRTAPPLARRPHGHVVCAVRPGADRDEKDPDLAFLSAVSCVPLQHALRRQHRGFAAFFAERARYPRFKSRRSRQSAHYTRSAFCLREGVLQLAKMSAPLPYVWSWPDVDVTALDPAMVIVSREPDGRWYLTFTIDTNDPEPLSPAGHVAGVDLGVTDFAVTCDGERIANPRHLERAVRAPPGRHRPLVPLVQDLLGVRAPARRPEPHDEAVDLPVLRRPA